MIASSDDGDAKASCPLSIDSLSGSPTDAD
jgi:hypothetical protein